MTTYAIRNPQAALLYELSVVLRKGAGALRTAAHRLDAWLEARRALEDLSKMSERELRDIGLDRADLRHAVRGGSPRAVDERLNIAARERLFWS